jgi:hypothetical protein
MPPARPIEPGELRLVLPRKGKLENTRPSALAKRISWPDLTHYSVGGFAEGQPDG